MPRQTISRKKFQEIAENNPTKERIQELIQLTPVMEASAKIDENKGVVARLKRTAQRALQLLHLATGATISLFFIIPLVLIIVVPILVLSLTFAMVCLPIVLLSTPFIWFFASKNKTTKQKNSDTLANETALLCTLQEASNNRNDRNEKVIGKENSNDNNTNAPVSPINYSLFFDEKNTQLPNSIQDQHASASISKSP
ncbi:hypothetical protein [Rickettsiella endosymbiont of Xylota segnis]|uniref:hypothetical protein n=1 Tax=Rickettsiella endosymbiont of Xylota segnis TaxID=3066238 RepID=UPI0030CF7551